MKPMASALLPRCRQEARLQLQTPVLRAQLGRPNATGPEQGAADAAMPGRRQDGCREEAEAVELLGQAHAHALLSGQHNLVYFKEPGSNSLGKEIFNRTAVLNSKMSKKRKVTTDRVS